MNWAAVTQTFKGYVKLIQFVVIWTNGWWPQKERLEFLLELRKLAEVSKKKKRKIVLELPYPQSEFPISNFSSRFQLSDGENGWWKMISFV